MADYQKKYEEIKSSFALLMQQNNSLKQQLKDVFEELQEKSKLKDEWSEEIDRIQETIVYLQNENQELQASLQLEGNWQKRYRELEEHYQNEFDSHRRQYQYEIEKLQSNMDQLEIENEKLQQQYGSNQETIYELKAQLVQKEVQLKSTKEESTRNIDSQKQSHFDEIKKLQTIIDNQSHLIQSYERVIEIEKSDTPQPKKSQHEKIVQYEDQLIEFKNRTIILNNKVNEERAKYEAIIDSHQDEVHKLQLIINDQKDLIQQYERIIERDKKQFDKVVQSNPSNQFKEQMHDLQTQNNELQAKVISLQQQIDYNQSYERQIYEKPYKYTEQPPSPQLPPYKPRFEQPNYKPKEEAVQTYKQDSFSRPPKTFFSNNKLSQLAPTKKKSFHSQESEESLYQKQAEKEFQEEFLYKFQNVIGRMEDKLVQMQSELNIGEQNKKTRQAKVR